MRTVLLAVGLLLARAAVGQQINVSAIEWQQGLGGQDREVFQDLSQLDDGGFIVGGTSFSPQGGNKTAPNFGAEDYWVVRLDRSWVSLKISG